MTPSPAAAQHVGACCAASLAQLLVDQVDEVVADKYVLPGHVGASQLRLVALQRSAVHLLRLGRSAAAAWLESRLCSVRHVWLLSFERGFHREVRVPLPCLRVSVKRPLLND